MNKIILAGTVLTKPIFSHEIFGEKFYEFYLNSMRLSNQSDSLPCLVSEIHLDQIQCGEKIKLIGDVRTRNVHAEESNHLEFSVFAKEIIQYEDMDENELEIEGYICKSPFYRKTPLGREITDLIIASNRPYGKTDYIPTIAWGRNAVRVSGYPIGSHVEAKGRLQSREYRKKVGDDVVTRIAYEYSVSTISEVADEQ